MKKKYDSYELEIIISLGFLILFLISINFISGYSAEKARRAQALQFEKQLSLSADYAVLSLQDDIQIYARFRQALEDRLQALSLLTGIENITIIDTLGQVVASCEGQTNSAALASEFHVVRPLNGQDGRAFGRLEMLSPNWVGMQLARLSRWDLIFRIFGLVSSLIVAAYFLRAVLVPYRRIKREALDFNLDLNDPAAKPGIEYIVSTFKEIISELEEKKKRLEDMYVSSQKRADSLARYNEYILGSITSGVVICDSSGIVTRFNPSAQNILMYLERDCRGRHYRDVFGEEHKLVSLLDDALHRRTVHSRLEFEVRRPDGKKLWLGCSSSLINDERGEEMGAALLLIDLTEIRRLQEISSYSEKMVALGETAAGLAHEVRNSFAAIVGFANLLKKSLPEQSAPLGKHIDAIRDESMAAESLMSRFLSFARPLNLNPEPVDVAELIESLLASFSHQSLAKINITSHLAGGIPNIKGDPMLLRQALLNLVINACDAMPDGGEVRVKAALDDKSAGHLIVISVTDNGIGIEPGFESKIFEPFISGKPDGTGLGLALVKKIVVMHGGRIEVRSRPGKGTKFSIYLPVETPQADYAGKESEALSFTPTI